MMTFLQHVYNVINDTNVLVLGFYDRNNAGDEMYKYVIPRIFPKARFTFKCMDDVSSIPKEIDTVLCGGGDIINKYFMSKAEKIFAKYTGKIYAFSVGVPYVSEARYLHLFDHVFARSIKDYNIACGEIGSKNVTLIPDASMFLCYPETVIAYNKKNRIGICLAQPAFYNNTNKRQIIANIANAIHDVFIMVPTTEFHLLSFNYGNVQSESDLEINCDLREALIRLDPDFPVFFPQNLKDPMLIFNKIKTMDVVLCMRYHSLLFSVINKKLIIAVYCTPKMNNIVNDLNDKIFSSYKLESDEKGMPLSFPKDWITNKIMSAIVSEKTITQNKIDWSIPKKLIFDEKKTVNVIIKNSLDSFENTLFVCKKMLMKYLNITSTEYENILNKESILDVGDHEYIDVARLLCYCVTKSMQSPYIWGLQQNMQMPNFCLYTAIKYIWDDFSKNVYDQIPGETYYQPVKIDRKVFVNLDFVFQSDFKSYHRSGWAYAIGGLMTLDAHQMLRSSDTLIDTYVDRSFHWGQETLQTVGIVPYTKPWLGFIHHTFDTIHSTYNCTQLFSNPVFVESLKSCKGLISLSDYLARDIKIALIKAGLKNVPVHVVYHPMETIENVFTMAKFNSNHEKMIVQIGAWLRNPYAIYELPLWKNNLKLQKAALKGKEMDHYFKPDGFFGELKKLLTKDFEGVCGEICRPVCRPNIPGNPICRNKYYEELYNSILRNDKSVKIIEKLSNDNYDDLLSKNIVFLNLVDCSAVNTVLECLVRNTPLIINRHPAIEEVFGKEYPGFYEDIIDATMIINSLEKIEKIHIYLKKLNKKRFTLERFVADIQNIVLQTH